MPVSSTKRVEVVENQPDLVHVACEIVLAAANISIGRRGAFRIALAGGSTPAPIYAALAADRDVDWRKWQIFWGDERTVPADHAASNYRMAHEMLLSRLETRPQWVMRVAGELEPSTAAFVYEETVRELVPPNYDRVTGDLPRFDMILLGMGNDGHTASLFPGTEALSEQTRLVVANPVPELETTRITFTYPLINAARRILFTVSGESKAHVLHQVLSGPHDPQLLPSQGVYPLAGALTWLVDEAAFSEIEPDMQDPTGA